MGWSSGDYNYCDDRTRRINMHGHKGLYETVFNYNDDFSGDVTITRDGVTISVPGVELLDLVINRYLGFRLLCAVEQLNLLTLIKKVIA